MRSVFQFFWVLIILCFSGSGNSDAQISAADPETELRRASDYLANHDYVRSMEICTSLFSDLRVQKDPGMQTRLLLLMYNNAWFSQSDPSISGYLDEALTIAKNSGDSALIGETCNELGKAFYRNGEYLRAIECYQESRDHIRDKGSFQDVYTAVYQHLSYTFVEDSCFSACNLSAWIFKQVADSGYTSLLSNAYLARAYCMACTGQSDSAKLYLQKAGFHRSQLGKSEASPGFYNQMYRVSLLIGEYDQALDYLERSLNQIISINKTNNASALAQSRAQFDYFKQKAKIQELRHQNNLEKERNARRTVIITTISTILILILALLIYIIRQNKNLRLSNLSLVKRYVEIDEMNARMTNCSNLAQQKRSGSFIRDEEEIYDRLSMLIEQDKIYRNKDLSLITLAELCNTNTTYLSSIINNRFGMNFKALVNSRRITEARKLLVAEEYSNFSIEGIANEVGFQSRSAFYQTFKQTTGLTPTDYIEHFRQIQSRKEVPDFEVQS